MKSFARNVVKTKINKKNEAIQEIVLTKSPEEIELEAKKAKTKKKQVKK